MASSTSKTGGAVAPNPARNRATAPDPTAPNHPRRGGRPWDQPQPYRPTPNPPRPTATAAAGGSTRPATRTWSAAAAELERDGDQALQEAAVRLHHELAQAQPTIRTAPEPEPLGRRLPAPLDAAR